jgi:hypothetical protein
MKFFSVKNESSYFKTLGIIGLELSSNKHGPMCSFKAKYTLHEGAR